MGNLNQVGILREDYRDLLRNEVGTGGPTLEEEARQGSLKRYGEDEIVNICLSLHALTAAHMDPSSKLYPSNEEILRDAIEILDYLDTLGMEVRHKR